MPTLVGKGKRITLEQPPTLPQRMVEFVSGGSQADVTSADAQVVGIHVTGLRDLEAAIMSVGKVFMDAAGFEMSNMLWEVIEDAQANFVPIQFGNLKDSGAADDYKPGTTATILKLAAWFGAEPSSGQQYNAAVVQSNEGAREVPVWKYALDQHENLGYRHAFGGPKYLELPFLAKAPEMESRIAKAAGLLIAGSPLPQSASIGNDLAGIEARINARPTYPKYGSKVK